MPPNLGGFFMVRSYYPSECHADYFDFERIEALKPAIEACGISTLSQSPMLGFHKQMDNRIKLLEEILSFRMQGVEFDNGDMYVDGHKAASDVRDEFVSVTEKLMDELAQCYNVLPQLDINNIIDHRPEGDEKWVLENEKTVTQLCRKLAAERPLKDIRDEYNYPKKKGIKDECSRLLEASTMKSRRGFAIQRLMNAMRQDHADGWFIVFDTLTLADDRLEAFYDNPNALRDYFRDIGRMVLAAEGRKANDSHADCYQYFCVPEYGTANGRLFFSSISRHTIFDCDWSSDVCSSDLLQPSLSFFLSFFHETISQRLTSLVSFHQRVSYNLLIIITTIAQVDIHPFCRCFIHCDDCAWIDRKSVV